MRKIITKPFQTHLEAVNCHHNYVQKETHFGEDVYVTRKGAVSARRVSLVLFLDRWAPEVLSCVVWEMKTALVHVVMVLDEL
jgi:RNA-splicing ligase RtcB